MNREIWTIVKDFLNDFKKYPVQIQDFRPIADAFGGSYGIFFESIGKSQRNQQVTDWTWTH